MTTQAVGDRRLLKLADILDVADAKHRAAGEPTYAQSRYNYDCGTPACALGHWAAANPHRWTWIDKLFPTLRGQSEMVGAIDQAAEEFALGIRGCYSEDARTIFGVTGCGSARTAKQAARFIRRFVKARAPK